MKTIHMHSLSLVAVAALTLAGNVAAQDKASALLNSLEVRQLVARAEPADHVRLGAHFTALADRYAAEAKRHTSMAQSFVGNPSRNLGTGMSAHCKQLANLNTQSATTVRELAAYHEKLASGSPATPPREGSRFQGGAGAPEPTEKELNALAAKAGTPAEHRALDADQRSDPQALRRILVPVQATGSVATVGGGNAGAGASAQAGGMVTSSASGAGGGMGSMGGGGGQSGMSAAGGTSANLPAPPMGGVSASPDLMEQWRQPGAAVPLGELADVRVTTGPPMIKDENGVLVGYVFADIDQTQRDLGGWVDDAKAVVASQLALPAGYRLQWTGQYEFLAEMEARLRYVIPLTLVLVVVLLYLSMRGWPQTFLVLSSLPFAVAGSVWLLAFMDYNLSTAVWVGLIAVAGVAAETGIVMVVYLDEAFARYMREGRIQKPEDVDAAVVEGASARVRPLVMTVATTVLGLLPLLWEAGVGADVSARTAAPVVGGLWSCMLLTLLVLPAAYAMWRRHQVRVAAGLSLSHDVPATSEGAA